MPTELFLDRLTTRRELRGHALARFLPAGLVVLLAAWLLVFIAYPVAVMLARSLAAKGGGLTLSHFQTFFGKAYFLRSLANTLILGTTVTALVTALGFALAYLVTRGPRPLRGPLRATTLAPLIAPPYIFGLALIIVAGRRGFLAQLLDTQIPIYGWLGVVLAQVLSLLPVAFLMIENVLQSLDPTLEDSACDLGAGEPTLLWTIILPLASPGLLKAALLTFGLAIADFGNPALLGGGLSFLAPDAFLMITGEWNTEMASVISVVLLVPSLAIFLAQHYWLKGKTYTTVSGAPTAAEERRIGRPLQAVLLIPALLYAAVILVCYGVILLGAVTKLVGIDNTLTLEHLLRDAGLDTVWTSLKVSLLAGAAAALVGTGLAYLCMRGEHRWRGLLEAITLIGFALPGTIMGIGYLLAFNHPPLLLTGTLAILVLNMIARFLAVGLEAGVSKLHQIDRGLEEASADLGAGALTTFRRIVLPLMSSAFAAGFLFTFMQSMISLSAAIFLVAPGRLLASVYIFNRAREGDMGIACAVSVILIGTVAICLAGLGSLARRTGIRVFAAHA
ncbi:MAG TPA: iron ABC transporter permease [Candidatus Methylomirabilis sp.]|nr:iron ABC transporter permease [Candidatus Methylomirabilis sp.]